MKSTDSSDARGLSADRFSLLVCGMAAFLIVPVALCVRLRFLSVPLERDEGEYAYAGQLMLDGINPYRFCYTMKLPGTAAAYAGFMAIFGQNIPSIHLALLLVNFATAFLIGCVARRLFSPYAGFFAGASYALFSLGSPVLGLAAHATQFVVLPAAGGLLLLLSSTETGRFRSCFTGGLLMGLAFLAKQPGLFFIVFGLFYLPYRLCQNAHGLRSIALRTAIFLTGALLPLVLTCLLFFASGSFGPFWFWVFDYANAYGGLVPLHDAVTLLGDMLHNVAEADWPLLLLVLIGALALVLIPRQRNNLPFIFLLLFCSCLAFSAGLHFRRHYFVLVLPCLSLLSACGIETIAELLRKRLPAPYCSAAALFLLAAFISLFVQREYLFAAVPAKATAELYSSNPFTEAAEIATYLEQHSAVSDRIAVIGSEPEIYFYAHRRSGTGYIYMYPLMEKQPFAVTMQQEMERELEASRPKFLVFVTTRLSWLVMPGADKSIIGWSEHFAHDHYRMVGVADNVDGVPEYHWQDAEHYQPKSPYTVYVFERHD